MITKTILLFYLIASSFYTSFSQSINPITKILQSNLPIISEVVNNLEDYELQILYTRIDRDLYNQPIFTDFKFNVDNSNYFYPASTVKLPASILALEKLNDLNIPHINKYTSLKIDSVYKGQSRVEFDRTSKNQLPSIGHYIKKILLVSNNDAFNRLYEFIGQNTLNKGLSRKGFNNFKLVHRLEYSHTMKGNKNSNPFTFYKDENIFYEQPAEANFEEYKLSLDNTLRGMGFIDSSGLLVNKPMDFSFKNFLSLEVLHSIIKRIIFPAVFKKSERFNITFDDYSFLYKYMSALPREVNYPKYDSTHYDSYVKFFMFGDSKKPIPSHIRIFNKVGLAYGFITDAAYIVDFENKIEFIISATLHVNKNKIYNDGVYEYDQIGIPFLSEFGRLLYNYELKRHREFLPDLSRFIID